MIVVIGSFIHREPRTRAAAIAARAAHAGVHTEAVGVVPGGSMGDRVALELSRDGVGHAALLRAARETLEPADVDLALRFLTEISVIVLTDVDEEVVEAAIDAAAWAGSRIVIVDETGDLDRRIEVLPDDAIVLEAAHADLDETFSGFVAELAVRLDGGNDPKAAWESAVRSAQVEGLGPRAR